MFRRFAGSTRPASTLDAIEEHEKTQVRPSSGTAAAGCGDLQRFGECRGKSPTLELSHAAAGRCPMVGEDSDGSFF